MAKLNFTHRRGTNLSDPLAHRQDHQQWSRRGFLRTLGLAGATSVGLSALPLTGLYGTPLMDLLSRSDGNRKLVLIRLKGGNDGLNTIVPLFDYDRYANLRPTLRHPRSELIGLNDDFAIPNTLRELEPLWKEDRMRVINSVGYPNHNLSHFTGADIIASGNNNIAENGDGWLARYYTDLNPDYRENPPAVPPAIKIGGPTSILFNDQDKVDISANFATPDGLEELATTGRRFNNQVAPDDCYYGQQVVFLRTVANAAYRYSSAIFDAHANSTTDAEYTSSLGDQLRLVARLIKGGLPTQLYLVTLDGFDTHVGQDGSHPALLEDLGQAVRQFYTDLSASNTDEEVLTMTYSEFGRRAEQNGVSGTDHGTAMPIMFFGPALNGSGIHGKNPDLQDLDPNGNLKFGTDFRSLYATLLQNWFCLDPAAVRGILGMDYEVLPDLGFSCGTNLTSTQRDRSATFASNITSLSAGRYQVRFTLPRPAQVQLDVFTINGQHLLRVPESYYSAASQSINFSIANLPLGTAPLVYTIVVDGRRMTAKQFIGTGR